MPSVVADTREIQDTFFRAIFGSNTEGFVCISKRRKGERSWQDKFFYYPADLDEVLDYVEQNYRGADMYVCTTLQSQKSRKAQFATNATTVWADLDECEPSNASPPPSIVLETSPGRYHGFWPLTHPIPAVEASDYSRRIAYELAPAGADRSGWDVSQVLRIPSTINFKYGSGVEVKPNLMLQDGTNAVVTFDPAVFSELPATVPTPAIHWKDIPGMGDVPTYAYVYSKYYHNLALHIQEYHSVGTDAEDWSAAFFAEMAELFQLGASLEDAFAFAKESKVNKFLRDNRGEASLWADILRIHHKVIVADTVINSDGVELPKLTGIKEPPDTFINEYVQWASTVTDAPPQYHEASAFMALSALLSSTVQVETSIGEMKLNLWFLILGETTITRKSTAMKLAMDIITEVDDEVLLGTEEGSTEGLLDALRIRPHMASIYYRDEVVGMLKGMAKREHMAGALETYTKLYDGSTMKRNLRKEVITVTDPIFIFFGGGIKHSLFDVVSDEHMESGFLPRFLYVIGESKIGDIKHIMRRTSNVVMGRERIVDRLSQIRGRYQRIRSVEVLNQQVTQTTTFVADPDDDALLVFNEFYDKLISFADKSDYKQTMIPVMSRTAMSALKMAALLAAARKQPNDDDDTITIEVQDIETAIYYVNKWLPYTVEVVANVGMPSSEKLMSKILEFINHADGAAHSSVMRRFHLSSYEMRNVVDTLLDRQLITMTKKGKTRFYHGFAH